MNALEVKEAHVSVHHYMGDACGGYRHPYYRVEVVGYAEREGDPCGWRCIRRIRHGEI